MKKRSDFEHKLNARGSQPSDYARYVEYEMNLDTLRRKREKRLGIKGSTHSGQRRIFFILERATRKFHGDLSLWMQYIEYARKERAHKKLSKIFMNVLRMHPTEAELWIYAARYALEEHADMTQSRSYMQRGLRFCKSSRALWVQYAKLEMIYITRIMARQRILGLVQNGQGLISENSVEEPIADIIAFPQITGEDINPNLASSDVVDQVALQNLSSTPALTGAIPIAIFDSAMKQFNNDDMLGRSFYDMVAEFEETPCLQKVLGRIVESLIANNTPSHHAQICHIKLAVAGIRTTSAQFPPAFGVSLSRLKDYMGSSSGNQALAVEVIKWIEPLLATDELDPALRIVMTSTMRSAERMAGRDVAKAA
jgi:U3 small nucleolar RNA-associated protein 6